MTRFKLILRNYTILTILRKEINFMKLISRLHLFFHRKLSASCINNDIEIDTLLEICFTYYLQFLFKKNRA